MSAHITNGHLVRTILRASETTNDPNHARAQGYLVKFRALEEHFFKKRSSARRRGIARRQHQSG